MAKDNGGIIGVLNTPSTSLASGVWALEDQYQAKLGGTWPFPFNLGSSSARFNSGSSDYLNRTPSSTGNRRVLTYSFWCKRSALGSFYGVLAGDGASIDDFIRFDAGSSLDIGSFDGATLPYQVTTSAVFRDVSAWYHFVIAFDTTQATNTNRIKVYVNGVQQTLTGTYPTQNLDLNYNTNGTSMNVGAWAVVSQYFNGYMTEINFIDGQALTPSSFGQTDTTTGIWIPKAYTGTYGTNGFYLNFSNASSLGTDSSGNANNWTVNNLTSVDQSKDHPTNNFDTLNPLMAGTASLTYSEGNTKIVFGAPSTWYFTTSTIAVTQGKWYCEVKIDAVGGETSVGIIPMETVADQQNAPSDYMGKESNSIGYVNNGQLYKTNSVQETTSTYTTGNIIGIAFNLDGNSIQFYKNGSAVGSAITLTSGLNYAVGVSGYNNSTQSLNFGQPPYSVSGGYSDGNGYGNFTYQPPSGFLALCTNNLASNG